MDLILQLRKIVEERLTRKQKYILGMLSNSNKQSSVTSFVKVVSSELNCSESAIWNNIASLKRCGLIETNEYIKLTSVMKILAGVK